ncbi:MAG: efflux RND transporter permease subunit [Gammaproteobacteria bacterium]
MLSQFFIDRPKFALVLSALIVMAGLLALRSIPVTQFPPITPPVVQVSAIYPGASAAVLESSVTIPLEEEINGVEDMLYISSKSSNSGQVIISVTFQVGTDPNMAQINVQNRVTQAAPRLPDEVNKQGISVKKQSTDMLLFINLSSPDKSLNDLFISNYAMTQIRNKLLRLPGVGEVLLFGSKEYSMRVWLNPNRMASLSITANDVAAAIREQNIQVAAGQIGQMPNDASQQFQYTLQVKGRLHDAAEFGDIIVRTDGKGGTVLLKDIARVELGAEDYSSVALEDGTPSTFVAIVQRPEANAIDTAKTVRAEMQKMSAVFPEGLRYSIDYDTTRFVEEAIDEVFFTLLLAAALVVGVIYLFLQDWRATLIPLATIPVSLIGTLAGLNALDYSINLVTLFGLILAIGIVVDDAIVVIENVQRLLGEGLRRREAAIESMRQVTGPIIATTLVLLAVFVPVGFIPGITGQLYRQFAATVSIAVAISSVNALTLSPALCATLLRGATEQPWWLLRAFNAAYTPMTHGYRHIVTRLVRRSGWAMTAFALLCVAAYWGSTRVPKAFLPEEDQGYFFVSIQLPEGAALPRTLEVMHDLGEKMARTPGVAHVIEVAGFNIISGTNASNNGFGVAVLKPWSERREADQSLNAILNKVQMQALAMREATIFAFNPPSIRGLGRTGGFEYQLQDTGDRNMQDFAAVLRGLLTAANQTPGLTRVFSTFQADVPQLFIDIDRHKAKTLGVSLTEIYSTLQAQLGSLYVNDFDRSGRVYQTRIQAEQQFRTDPAEIYKFYVRSAAGEMIPLRSLLTILPITGADTISRHNLFRAEQINGSALPGFSSGEAMQTMADISARTLPNDMTFQWSGMSLQEQLAGSHGGVLFVLALLFVYLFLVAQYESWSLPLAVMLAVPVAAGGALAALMLARLSNDLYTQIGLIMLIGIASKNAILVVEFAAKHLEESLKLSTRASDSGENIIKPLYALHESPLEVSRAEDPVLDAAVTAACLRFRAVLMTALSFILGVIPLAVASGAGAASRHSLGIPVIGGMLAAVLIGSFWVPVFYVFVSRLVGGVVKNKKIAGRNGI